MTFVVDDTFVLKDRGLIVAGWIDKDSSVFRIGDLVEIQRPNGTKINSEIMGVEIFVKKCFSELKSNEKENIALMLKNLTKDDVPINSVIKIIT